MDFPNTLNLNFIKKNANSNGTKQKKRKRCNEIINE